MRPEGSQPLAMSCATAVASLGDEELVQFQALFKQHIGLHLTREKKALLVSRLARRLTELRVASFGEYHRLITASGQWAASELQYAIDLITTNETRFFRDAVHFDFLRERCRTHTGKERPFHVWSAASSSGEEAFSLAMVLDDTLGDAPWHVLGSDISQRMLHKARRALYPLERSRQIPLEYLKRYCLRGQYEYEGQLLVERSLRERVSFVRMNLTALPDALGPFDVIFLRNVLIYFDLATKNKVIEAVLRSLRPGGYLVLGLAESLQGVAVEMENIMPAVYRKPRGVS